MAITTIDGRTRTLLASIFRLLAAPTLVCVIPRFGLQFNSNILLQVLHLTTPTKKPLLSTVSVLPAQVSREEWRSTPVPVLNALPAGTRPIPAPTASTMIRLANVPSVVPGTAS